MIKEENKRLEKAFDSTRPRTISPIMKKMINQANNFFLGSSNKKNQYDSDTEENNQNKSELADANDIKENELDLKPIFNMKKKKLVLKKFELE